MYWTYIVCQKSVVFPQIQFQKYKHKQLKRNVETKHRLKIHKKAVHSLYCNNNKQLHFSTELDGFRFFQHKTVVENETPIACFVLLFLRNSLHLSQQDENTPTSKTTINSKYIVLWNNSLSTCAQTNIALAHHQNGTEQWDLHAHLDDMRIRKLM